MTEPFSPMIVAIDGPSGVGKSTVARALARRLGIPYLETGAMYRALGLRAVEEGVDPADRVAVARLVEELDLELIPTRQHGITVVLDGEALGDSARLPRVSEATSKISAYPDVRRYMVDRQREGAQRAGAVLEGRDIGTKVFPDTPFKFFLDADPVVRAERRYRQLLEEGASGLQVEDLEAEIAERDLRDSTRSDSPLQCDDSYLRIDTGSMTVDEIVDLMAARILEIR